MEEERYIEIKVRDFKGYTLTLMVLSIVIGICLSMLYQQGSILVKNRVFDLKPEVNGLDEIVEKCDGLDLEKTAKCMRDNLMTIYNYKSVKELGFEKNVDRSFDEIKRDGGNCYDYTHLYRDIADELGVKNKIIQYNGIKNVKNGHMYLVIYDDEKYCEIDQTKVNCEEISI